MSVADPCIPLRDYVDTLHKTIEKAIELERMAASARFEAILREQLRQFPDRVAHEKLESRILEVERQASNLAGRLGVIIALVSTFFGALQIVLHLVAPK